MQRWISLVALALVGVGCDDGGSGQEGGPSGGGSGLGGAAGNAGTGWPGGGGGGAAGGAGSAGQSGELAWPNASAPATSDPWLIEHHDQVEKLRPRVLALNFVNSKTNEQMLAHLEQITAAIREATRPHGYADASAEPMVEYEIAYAIDLRDAVPPPNYPYRNSTKYPREQPPEGYWSFDYEQLFSAEFAQYYAIGDPPLDLCQLSEQGLVHEVWIYGDADVPDVSAAEVLGIMPHYDADFQRVGPDLDRCAGNGCFDAEDEIPASCTRTLRIGWVNDTRGVGCYMESLTHGIETIGGGDFVPYWKPYFREFAGFDLNTRYGLPFESWYACSEPYCLSYSSPTSVSWLVGGGTGTIDPYFAVCGSAHFPPNARGHYDVTHDQPVAASCESYRRQGGPGSDPTIPTSASQWSAYESIAGDCTGQWLVYMWQSFPGPERVARDADGKPMKNWWPFLFY